MKKGKCAGMGDLMKDMGKKYDSGGMMKGAKMPTMPKAMPIPKGGGGGKHGGGHK